MGASSLGTLSMGATSIKDGQRLDWGKKRVTASYSFIGDLPVLQTAYLVFRIASPINIRLDYDFANISTREAIFDRNKKNQACG
ncbi:MAG: hypothetical protein ACO3S1_08030 [Candidatus Puniceispirillaceae bacterium]